MPMLSIIDAMSKDKVNGTPSLQSKVPVYVRDLDPKNIPAALFARLMGIKNTRVHQWINRGMPVVRVGSRGVHTIVDMHQCLEWYIDVEANDRASLLRRSDGETSYAQEEHRLKKAQADHKELIVAQMRNELVDIGDVKASMEDLMVILAKHVMDLPGRLSSDLAVIMEAREIKTRLHEECARALRAAADHIEEYCEVDEQDQESDGASDAVTETVAADDSISMGTSQ